MLWVNLVWLKVVGVSVDVVDVVSFFVGLFWLFDLVWFDLLFVVDLWSVLV